MRSDDLPITNKKRDNLPITNKRRDTLPITNNKRDELPITNKNRDTLPITNKRRDTLPNELPITNNPFLPFFPRQPNRSQSDQTEHSENLNVVKEEKVKDFKVEGGDQKELRLDAEELSRQLEEVCERQLPCHPLLQRTGTGLRVAGLPLPPSSPAILLLLGLLLLTGGCLLVLLAWAPREEHQQVWTKSIVSGPLLCFIGLLMIFLGALLWHGTRKTREPPFTSLLEAKAGLRLSLHSTREGRESSPVEGKWDVVSFPRTREGSIASFTREGLQAASPRGEASFLTVPCIQVTQVRQQEWQDHEDSSGDIQTKT